MGIWNDFSEDEIMYSYYIAITGKGLKTYLAQRGGYSLYLDRDNISHEEILDDKNYIITSIYYTNRSIKELSDISYDYSVSVYLLDDFCSYRDKSSRLTRSLLSYDYGIIYDERVLFFYDAYREFSVSNGLGSFIFNDLMYEIMQHLNSINSHIPLDKFYVYEKFNKFFGLSDIDINDNLMYIRFSSGLFGADLDKFDRFNIYGYAKDKDNVLVNEYIENVSNNNNVFIDEMLTYHRKHLESRSMIRKYLDKFKKFILNNENPFIRISIGFFYFVFDSKIVLS